MNNANIHINFFPVINQDFEFHIYIHPCADSVQKTNSFLFPVKKYKLLIESNETYQHYFVAFDNQENFQSVTINANNNNVLTLRYLYESLVKKLTSIHFEYILGDKYRQVIDIINDKFDIGNEAISLLPVYNNGTFGFLVDYHFIKERNVPFNKAMQIKSLSLDSSGESNLNYYSDKYQKIQIFVKSKWNSLFNPLDESTGVIVSNKMLDFSCHRLDAKKYIFGNGKYGNSQFKGIATNGPYGKFKDNPFLCFVYRNDDIQLSRELYLALQGKTYPTFRGMQAMFGLQMNKDNVKGFAVDDYTEASIDKLISEIKLSSCDRNTLPIVLVPWVKDTATDEQSKSYFLMKHHFLQNDMPSQFVGIPRAINYNSLKWSISSIGLQIFTKIGGSPWCMDAKTKNCLIIGIGQSYKIDDEHHIERYFSYSILSDSSGLFQNIKILSEADNERQYLDTLSKNLKSIIELQMDDYTNIAIHTSFRVRDKEIRIINNIIMELSTKKGNNFVVLRFNNTHHYMGFDMNNNALTPYESSVVQLSKKDYLVWFEGLSSVTNTIRTRIGQPMHIFIDYARSYDYSQIEPYLQDALNLSGANWRGFNAKTTPVSILYAKLLSGFLAAFDKYNLDDINIEKLTPWFL
jgi:hypothetical protein